jgi:hypothetical protein
VAHLFVVSSSILVSAKKSLQISSPKNRGRSVGTEGQGLANKATLQSVNYFGLASEAALQGDSKRFLFGDIRDAFLRECDPD